MSWESFNSFTSSNISGLRYESGSLTLEVSFLNGGVYQYYDVPINVWNGMKSAESQGKYLHEFIKGHFRYSKV